MNRIIPDGLSFYNEELTMLYDKIRSIRAPKDLFNNVSPDDSRNKFGFELTVAELDLYRRLNELSIKYEVIESSWFAKNDLFMFGREWELKTIKRKN